MRDSLGERLLMLRRVWSVVMLMLFWALPGLSAHAQQDYLEPAEAFRLSVTRQADDQVRLTWEISKGYYLYRKQMKVEADPAGATGPIDWPAEGT